LIGKVVPVSGKVTRHGQLVTGGLVTFYSEDGKVRAIPSGALEANGTYRLTTEGKVGAPPGKYKVIVTPPGAIVDPNKLPEHPPEPTPPQPHESADTTPLRKEVAENAPPDAYDIELK